MKIFVINEPFVENFCRTQRWAARTRGRVMRPPDWLAYITAVLERSGHDVRLFDFPANNWGEEHFISLIERGKPNLVVLDSTTPSIYSDINYARICKEFDTSTVTIMVGPHATSLPEDTLREADGAVDIVVRGEPEATMNDVVEKLEQGRALEEVEGISFRKNGSIVSNAQRALIDDLDVLPFPAWHHLDLKKYFDGIKLFPFIDIIGGRGCPYQCAFCLWPQVMHGNKYRLRSPQNIIEEMKYDLRLWPWVRKGEFFFEDDTFTVKRERAIELCERISMLPVPVTWSVNVRADHGDSELFSRMKRAGCRMLLIGYESGNRHVLESMNKKLRPAVALQTARAAVSAGLKLHGCFVLGYPGETFDSMEETVRFALELPLDTVQFSAAAPFPGTRFFERCEEEGYLRTKHWPDWLADGEQAGVIELPLLSPGEVAAKVDEALRRFYFRPSYMTRFLFQTNSFGDLYRKLRGARNFVTYLFDKMQK